MAETPFGGLTCVIKKPTILLMKNFPKYLTIFAFLIAAALISVLLVLPRDLFQPKKNDFRQTRYINQVSQNNDFDDSASAAEIVAAMEAERSLVNLGSGEIAAAALSEDFDSDGSEETIIAYRNMLIENNPIYLTYIDYEENTKQYNRIWSAPTQVTRPGTISLFTKDLTGDRSVCVILTGMNGEGEHTMTIFKIVKSPNNEIDINRIADIKIDGTISIVEIERTQAYQLGLTNGASFDIKGRGRDTDSSNEFDQIEITYSYSREFGRYIRNGVNRIPGAQVEAARLNRLLNATAAEFEQFVSGLWYRAATDTPENSRQYIYFDTSGRELIFYDNNTQQVYKWLSSTSTRYGLYISSQNISVGTLRRVMDIELESVDSVRVKIFEDVRMKIGLNALWDGTYRKVSSAKKTGETPSVNPFIDGEYSSSLGTVAFLPDGKYIINRSERTRTGRYAFFMLDGGEYLELLPDETADGRLVPVRSGSGADGGQRIRDVYRVDRSSGEGFSLRRVRLSVAGLLEFDEEPVAFMPLERGAS